MRWLITGATGFIGGVLLRCLIQDAKTQPGDSYVLLVRDMGRLDRVLQGASLPPQFHVVAGDLHQLEGLGPYVSDITGVLHIAGLINAKREQDFQYTNVDGTQYLHQYVMQAATARRTCGRRVKWIQISSIAANGPVQMVPEERRADVDQDRPASWYGQSKLDADNYLRQSHPPEDLIIVRPPAVFGKEDRAWISIMKLIKKRFLPVWVGKTCPYYSFINSDVLVKTLRVLMTWDRPIAESVYPTFQQPAHWNQMMTLTQSVLSNSRVYFPIPLSFGMLRVASKTVDLLGSLPGIERLLPISGDKIRLVSSGHLVKDGGKQLQQLGIDVPKDLTVSWKECISYWQTTGII